MYNTNLKYRKFDQLLDDVRVDFKTYDLENYIEPQELIKVAQNCSALLGLRIQMTKEVILDVEKGRVRLPFDFNVANYGLMCGQHSIVTIPGQGTTTEEVPFPRVQDFNHVTDLCSNGTICSTCNTVKASCKCGKVTCDPVTVPDYNPLVPYGDYCTKPRVFMNCKGQSYELIQIIHTEIRKYSYTMPLKFLSSSQGITCECPNLYVKCVDEVYIKDGWLYANFDCGKIYLNYQGALQDEEGNLLVLDHLIINPYYEYSLKERILENMWIENEDVERKMGYIREKAKEAKAQAMLVAVMPNFNELKKTWETNRKAQYYKYYTMFSSYGNGMFSYPYSQYPNNNTIVNGGRKFK